MFSHAQQKYGNTVVTERTATVALCIFAVLQLTPLTQTEHFLLLQPHIKTMEGEHLLLSAICFFWSFLTVDQFWMKRMKSCRGHAAHLTVSCCLQELVCFASPRILRPVVLNRTYRHYIKYLMYLMCPKSNQTLNHKIQRTNVWWSDVSIVSVNSPVGKCLPGARLDVWCVVKTVYDVKPQNSH